MMRCQRFIFCAIAIIAVGCSGVPNAAPPGPQFPARAKSAAPHQPRLFVVNGGNNTITVYDEKGNLLQTSGGFPNVDGPGGIAYDPLDRLLYVAMSGRTGTSIATYNTDGHELATCGFPIAGGIGVAFDPSNRELYVADFGSLPGPGAVRARPAKASRSSGRSASTSR